MIDKILLFPYYLHLRLRNARYARKTKLYYPSVPSLCVGNITVGGTGKTPHVELILRLLSQSETWSGKQLAVLSRGYKRESKGFQQVVPEGSAAMFGDEPLQIKRAFPEVVVAVDRKRERACEYLTDPGKLKSDKCWYPEFPAADYIILDDAFQYRRLAPAKTVLLVDYNRPVHRDMLLPLGRLRDLASRVHEAPTVIITKCPYEIDQADKERIIAEMGLDTSRQLVLFTRIEYKAPRCVFPSLEPRYAYSKKAILVTGIANPTPLRRFLSDNYKIVSKFHFPDHHSFTWADINKIKSALRRHPTAAIFTTEKDAQRLLDFAGMPSELAERFLYVPIECQFTSPVEQEQFIDYIEA